MMSLIIDVPESPVTHLLPVCPGLGAYLKMNVRLELRGGIRKKVKK